MITAAKTRQIFSLNTIARFILLNVGLLIFAEAIVFAKQAGLGLGAWDVFHLGLSLNLPITFGQANQVTGLALIVLTLFMGIKPGLGTISNMFFIGLWIDLTLSLKLVPEMSPYGLAAQLFYIVLSLTCFSIGSALYIKSNFGTGPRDSLMVALVRRTGWRVSICRAVIEIAACGIGWLLGGTVGLATVLLAIGIGPAVGIGFKLFHVDVRAKQVHAQPQPS